MIDQQPQRRTWRRRPTRRVAALAGAAVLIVAVGAGFGVYHYGGPALHSQVRTVGIKVPAGRYGHTWTIGDLPLCVNDGTVTITSVRPVGSHGQVTVTGWGMHDWTGRPSDPPTLTSTDGRPLRDVAPWMTRQPISARCHGSDYPFTELAVEIRIDNDGPIATHGFDVGYRNGRRERHVRVDYTFIACPDSSTPGDSCTA